MSNVYIQSFIDIINDNAKEGMVVAEIGVAEGNTSSIAIPIVSKYNGTYYAVDWFKGNVSVHPDNVHGYRDDEKNIESRKTQFLERINNEEYNNNVNIVVGNSYDVASKFDDESLDICFIDAEHNYPGILRDIYAYYPKVKYGGIICGHDYEIEKVKDVSKLADLDKETLLQDFAKSAHYGVIKAVYETFHPYVEQLIHQMGGQVWKVVKTEETDKNISNIPELLKEYQ